MKQRQSDIILGREIERATRRDKMRISSERRDREESGKRNKADPHAKYPKFVRRMGNLLHIHPADVYEVLVKRNTNTARINTLKFSLKDSFNRAVEAAGINPIVVPWYPDSFSFTENKHELFKSELISSGMAFIQNASSFLPVLAMQPKEDEDILDICAAPGGKASHIAALTNNKSRLWVNDGNVSRIHKIKEVQEILGANFERVTHIDGKFIDREVDRQFDRILLDAQCSGEGMIDLSNPRTAENWSIDRVEKHYYLQVKMLKSAFKVLKPGGTLIYSTCTFAPEENEAPVSTLLRDFEDAVLEPLILDLNNTVPAVTNWEGAVYHPSLSMSLRVVPNDYMEGFFVCRIRKLGDGFTSEDIQPINLVAEGKRQSKVGKDLNY